VAQQKGCLKAICEEKGCTKKENITLKAVDVGRYSLSYDGGIPKLHTCLSLMAMTAKVSLRVLECENKSIEGKCR